MGDEFDPCECVWNHENAMQRLISLLRNSQDTCTDNECLTSPGLQGTGPETDGYSMTMFIMMAWLLIATALFMFRPASMRSDPNPKHGPRNNGQDPPPPSPPSVN